MKNVGSGFIRFLFILKFLQRRVFDLYLYNIGTIFFTIFFVVFFMVMDNSLADMAPYKVYTGHFFITKQNLHFVMLYLDFGLDSFMALKEYYFANINNLDPAILDDLVNRVNKDFEWLYAIDRPGCVYPDPNEGIEAYLKYKGNK